MKRLAIVLWLTGVLLLAACSPRVNFPARSPAVLDVTMTDNRFVYDGETLPRGRVVFRLVNEGRSDHEVVLLPLPEEFPPIEEQLRSDERRALETVAGPPAVDPGDNQTFAVDLTPGRYAMVCFVLDEDGVPHSLKGMASEFGVS